MYILCNMYYLMTTPLYVTPPPPPPPSHVATSHDTAILRNELSARACSNT